jgi:hypothetical protein
MIATNIKRPRNVNVPRAAAILYGDWGTSSTPERSKAAARC